MANVSTNLHYLLWKHEVPRATWFDRLARWAGCDVSRVRMLLQEEQPTQNELQRIGQSLNLSEDDLMSVLCGNLLEQDRVNVVKENLLFLIAQW